MKKQIDQLKERIQPHLTRAKEIYVALSPREKNLLVGGVSVLLIISVMIVNRPISSRFEEQSLELIKVQQDAHNIANELNRYQRLIQRRAEIEQDFKSVEIREGALSHLEGLIRSKAGIEQGQFTIKDQPPKPFGNQYEQAFFTVNFNTTNYPRLIDFLEELVDGPKPLVIKRLDLKRSRGGDRLEVELEISSITKVRA